MTDNSTHRFSREQKTSLAAIAQAFRLSAHVLTEYPGQLTSQMVGRLYGHQNAGIQSLILEGAEKKRAAWFRPLSTTLTPPGGPLLRTIELPEGTLIGMNMSPDGKRAAAATGEQEDHSVRVWDLDSGKELHALSGHASWVKVVALPPDCRYELTGTWDDPLELWDLETGELLHRLEGHTSLASTVAISADGNRAVSVQKKMRVWNLQTGELLHILEGHSERVTALALTSDGRRAITGSRDRTLKIWNLESGELENILRGHEDHVLKVRLTSDGRRAFSTSRDSSLRIWDVETGDLLHTFTTDGIHEIDAITPDGVVGISTARSPFKLWNLVNGEVVKTFDVHKRFTGRAAIDAEGNRAITVWRNSLNVWDLDSDAAATALNRHDSSVKALAVTSNGKRMVSGAVDGSIKIWDPQTMEVVSSLTGNKDTVGVLAFTPVHQDLIVSSFDTPLTLWDLGREVPLQVTDLDGYALAVAPDGSRVFSYSDKTIRDWDLEEGRSMPPLTDNLDTIRSMAVTHDGTRIVYGTGEGGLTEYGAVCIWDLASNQRSGKLGEHSGNVNCVVVSPDDKFAVSGSGDRTIKVWPLDEKGEAKMLRGHQRRITSLALTPDSRWLVSASLDRTVRLWDLETGIEAAAFTMEDPIDVCAISPDGTIVITGDQGGKVNFLALENLSMGPLICTARDYGEGPAVLCPACGSTCRIEVEQLGREITCPHQDCETFLAVNPFFTRMTGAGRKG